MTATRFNAAFVAVFATVLSFAYATLAPVATYAALA